MNQLVGLRDWLAAQSRRAISVGGIAAFTELNLQLGRGENDAAHFLDGVFKAAWGEVLSHGAAAAVIMVVAPALLIALRKIGARDGREPLNADWILNPPPRDESDRF